MEAKNNLDHLLSEHMRAENISAPSPQLVAAARNLVISRRPAHSKNRLPDFISTILNLRIRLNHALLGCIAVMLGVIVFSNNKSRPSHAVETNPYATNIAAVRNSTVLSSINTFI